MSYISRTFSMYSRGLGRVDRAARRATFGLGLCSHSRAASQPLLEVAHAGEVLVEPVAVARRRGRAGGRCAWPATASRMLRPSVELADLRVDLGRACPGGTSGGRRRRPSPRRGSARPMPVHERLRWPRGDVDAERERGEPREVADPLGDVLVERDRVAEPAAAGVRRGGEEAVVGRVPAVDVGVRDAAEDGEVVAVLLEQLQVGRGLVVAAGLPSGRTTPAAGRGCCRCASIRRGGLSPASRLARRTPGRIASSSGSDRATPAPRRNCAAARRADGSRRRPGVVMGGARHRVGSITC